MYVHWHRIKGRRLLVQESVCVMRGQISRTYCSSLLYPLPEIKFAVIYYGLEDVYGAVNGDYVVMDAHANVHMFVGYTHHQTLVDMHPVPLCGNDYVADEDNDHGNCPADGTYSFVTSFPTEEAKWYDWAMTGYKGDLVLDMYLNSTMQLVGRCKGQMKTVSRGIAPSAKHVSVICLLAASVYVVYTIIRYTRPQWIARARRFRLRDIHQLLDPDEKKDNWVTVTRETVPPYKRKDNSWSTEQLVMA